MLYREFVKSPSTKLFVPQVLNGVPKPTDPGQWLQGQIKVSQKQADKYSDGFALPHCTGTHTHPCICT